MFDMRIAGMLELPLVFQTSPKGMEFDSPYPLQYRSVEYRYFVYTTWMSLVQIQLSPPIHYGEIAQIVER